MESLACLISFLLASMGLTVLIVWPETGPAARLREAVRRYVLRGKGESVLDCYVCMGFWSGLGLSPFWASFTNSPLCWAGCLMNAAIFWLVLRVTETEGESDREPSGQDKPGK